VEPVLDRERRARPSLQDIQVSLGFTDRKLPRTSEHAALARELVRVVEVVAPHPMLSAHGMDVVFLPRDTILRAGSQFYDVIFLATEDWPQASKHLSWLKVSRWWGLTWPPWQCPDITCAWLGPEVEELRRVLEGKASKARNYNLGGSPLWLLVVCEVSGDLQSHIFPRLAELLTGLQETGFDFPGGPFSEVWLLSAFGGGRLRLHPFPA
jgi:hypothetical protein